MSTPSLTSHNSNSSSSFSSSSSSSSSSSTPITTTELSTINLIPDKKLNPTKTIIESLTKTKSKTSLDHIINETIPTNNDSLILLTKTSEIVQKTIKSKEFEKNKTDDNYQQHQRQQQQQINDFVDETFRKNLLNFNNNNNNNNDLKLLSTNKINNKKRRNNCNNLFDITDNKNENIKNDTIVSNDIIINNIQCLQSNINDDIDQNLDEIYPPIKSIKILPTLNQNNDINNIIDQQNLLEINIDKNFIINNNNIDNNKNIQDISPLYNSPNSNSCNNNNNNNNSSTTSNTNVSNSSNNSTSSGGSILAQTNTSSATTTLSPFYGCNSTNIITSNNNNNLLTINGKQQKQLSVNVSSLFNINDHKEENKINVNFNLNNNNSSIRNIIHNKINNDTITEQMNIKEESTGNLLESGKAQIKIEDEPPPSQSPVCHTSIMSDINIKKESKNISSPSSSSSSSTGNNGNGTGTNVGGNSSEVPNNNNTNIIGSTNTGSILHSSSSGGCGGSSSGVGINNNSISSTDNKKSDGSTDDMLSKDDMLADNNTEMNTTIKKEESATDLSTDGFSPLCTSHNVGGSSNNGNNVNMQPILNSGGGQVVSSGNSIVNPTSSSSIGSNNNNNSTCGLSSNNRGGNRMGISPPECGIQSLSSSNSINVSGSGPGNGNNIGGGGGGNNNGGNGGNNNNKQSMGNNGGLGAVDYMQQQNHIFVFSTQLANKGAESVLTGQYPTMIAYHCAQPTTKKFLEDFFLKNPMKLSKMNRQNSVNSQWIQQQNLNNNNNSHKLIQNKQNNNNNISSINSNNNNNNSNRTSSIKSSISTSSSSSTIPSNLQTNSTNNFVNDELSGNDASDILSWEHNANHLGLDTLPNGSNLDNMDDNSGIVSRESPTDNVTGSTGNNNNNNRNQMQSSTSIQQQSPTMLTSNTLTGGPTSPSLSCLQPSLQGVKVPDENLTPQQRQHREEQLAKLKKMNQFLFPEHTSGMGPDFISGSGIPTDNTTDQNLIGTNNIVGNVITPSNSKLISSGGPSGLVNQSVNNSSNVPVGMISGNSGGGSGSVSSVIGPNNNSSVSGVSAGPNNIPIIPNLSSGNGNISIFPLGGPQNNRGGGVNNNNNNMMSVSSGSGLGSRNIGPICRQIGSLNNMSDNMMGNNLNDFGIMMGSGNHNSQQNQQSIMNSIISGGGPMSSQLGSMGPGSINQCGPLGGSSGMMIGSGQKNIGGIAQMEWNKLQHQYYEERTKGGKGSIDGIPIGELCNSSQNISGVIGPNGRQIISSGNNNNGPPLSSSGPIRQNSQNCQRSQGPPPPYHQTPRSASVPIATQSPNPGSPNNPTSNLSLPSPRTAGSTLNSPAGDVTTTTNSGTGGQQQGNKSQQLQYKQDSPPGGGNTCNNSNGNSGTNNNRTALSHSSNPNTPISSHMSPNASLKDLELGNTSLANSNQDICDNNLMPVPSPEQVQNLNIFEEELTIQKHINRQNSFTIPLSSQTPNFDKNRMNTSGPSPQGPRTPSMIGEHSNPSSIDSRFPPASPNINFSPVTGQNNQNQSGGGGNVQQQQQQIGPGSNNNQQKLQNFMDGGSGSGKCSASVNETTTSNFSLRADNLPLNPHTNCPPPAKPSHFDPISSLAQMSQQLTNSVSNSVNGGHGSNPGMMGGFPNHGGMGMSPGDMSIGPHGPVPDNLMGSGGGMDPCSMAAMGLGGMGGGNIGGPPGVLQGGPGGQYVMHGVPQNNMSAFGPMSGIPPRSLSPKLGGVGTGGIMSFPGNGPPIGMQAHRMMGRPMIGPGSGNPYNGANIQVKASTPNTIQYLPARPQIGNNNPRAPPSLEFLQRFANPIPGMDNCQPNKMSGGGGGIGPSGGGGGGQNMPSFYTNCNQIGPNGMSGGGSMNHPHGLDNSGLGGPDGNNSMMNMNMIGPGINPGNSMCGPMGQNIMMRGLRPPGQGGGGGMLRMPVGQNMSGSPGIGHHHHHHHHHSFSNGPQNNTQQNDSSMFSNQMFGGGPGGPKVNPLNMLGGPNSGGGGVGSQMPGSGSSIMQSETGQSLPSSLSGPGQSGGPNNGSGNSGVGSGGPGSGGPNNFKSQFVGPSTADPNYAQQYHNFQQQLYATSTRSQPSGPGGNNGIPGGPTSSNQSFFVPK